MSHGQAATGPNESRGNDDRKVVMIVGGDNSSLSELAVKLFLECGAQIIIAHANDDLKRRMDEDCTFELGSVECNVADSDVGEAVKKVQDKYGKIDIIFNIGCFTTAPDDFYTALKGAANIAQAIKNEENIKGVILFTYGKSQPAKQEPERRSSSAQPGIRVERSTCEVDVLQKAVDWCMISSTDGHSKGKGIIPSFANLGKVGKISKSASEENQEETICGFFIEKGSGEK